MENQEINKQELETEIVPIRQYAENIVIKKDDENILAADYLRKIKTVQKTVKAKFKDPIEKAYQAHKAMKALQDEFLTPLEIAEDKIKRAMCNFERDAEIERRRLQGLQEQEARQIEAEARRLEEQAAKLQERGKDEKAEVKQEAAFAVQQKADEIRQTVIEKPMTKNAGISYMETWKYEILAPAQIPREYLTADDKKIGQVVRATKGTLQIAGIRIYSEKTVASRSY